MLKAVFDTNIFIASALEPNGLCSFIIREFTRAKDKYKLFISPDIVIELFEKINEYNNKGILSESITKELRFLTNLASLTKPIESISAVVNDPDDNKILECAVAAKADLIVTMDKDLLKLKRFRNIGIVHPKTFYFMLPKN
jgi:putative PIN family toxin of toxin-antitoxin system